LCTFFFDEACHPAGQSDLVDLDSFNRSCGCLDLESMLVLFKQHRQKGCTENFFTPKYIKEACVEKKEWRPEDSDQVLDVLTSEFGPPMMRTPARSTYRSTAGSTAHNSARSTECSTASDRVLLAKAAVQRARSTNESNVRIADGETLYDELHDAVMSINGRMAEQDKALKELAQKFKHMQERQANVETAPPTLHTLIENTRDIEELSKEQTTLKIQLSQLDSTWRNECKTFSTEVAARLSILNDAISSLRQNDKSSDGSCAQEAKWHRRSSLSHNIRGACTTADKDLWLEDNSKLHLGLHWGRRPGASEAFAAGDGSNVKSIPTAIREGTTSSINTKDTTCSKETTSTSFFNSTGTVPVQC